jgi:hypothetical protein
MPIEAVLEAYPGGGPTREGILDFVQGRLDQDEDRGGAFSTLYGPVPSPERYGPPAEPRALAERRLGGYLRQVAALAQRGQA